MPGPKLRTRTQLHRTLLMLAGVVMSLALCVTRASAQSDPASLPARDAHEGVLVAADPYVEADRAKKTFGKKNPLDFGIVPIEVIIRNDNDKPILLGVENIRLLLSPPGGERQQIGPMSVDDVIDKMLNKGGPGVNRPRTPIPGRLPHASKDKQWQELESRLRPLAFEMTLLPPKGTLRGFFFFNVGRRTDVLQHARLYVPDLKYMHNKQPLFFFEVDLSKALP